MCVAAIVNIRVCSLPHISSMLKDHADTIEKQCTRVNLYVMHHKDEQSLDLYVSQTMLSMCLGG